MLYSRLQVGTSATLPFHTGDRFFTELFLFLCCSVTKDMMVGTALQSKTGKTGLINPQRQRPVRSHKSSTCEEQWENRFLLSEHIGNIEFSQLCNLMATEHSKHARVYFKRPVL